MQTPRPLSRWLALALASVALPLIGPTTEADAAPVACDWPITLAYDGLNVLGPDTQASYWLLDYEVVPGTSLRIEGEYPDARFFSHTVQDMEEITLGAVLDKEIRPDRGDVNPYRTARSTEPGQRYSIRIAFDDPPATGPARNTLYAGTTYNGDPNLQGTLVYRVYVPTDQSDPQGGVPLPTVTWETPAGDVDLTLDACQPLLGGLGGPLNEQTEDLSRPDGLPSLLPAGKDYRVVPSFVRLEDGYFTDPVVGQLPGQVGTAFPTPDGIPLANAPFPYLRSSITRKYGQVLAVRFKAASFPDTVRGESVTRRTQARYWSLCSYSATEEALLRGSGCLTDFRTATDRRGFVTVVVADPAHLPSGTIRPRHGVHWLRWGPYDKDFLLFRMGIPAPTWQHSPLGIDASLPHQPAVARRVMGPYYPLARYCSTRRIEQHGVASCFASHRH